MASFMPDSSAMVASVSTWHDHHDVASQAIEDRLANGDRMVIAAHSLVETYSVLTRMPAARRLSPQDARTVISDSFIGHGTVTSLPTSAYLNLLDWMTDRGIAGGRAYDALIVATAEHAGVDTEVTLNGRDFRALARTGIEIVVLV